MVPKHVAFAPASQKQLGSRLHSPLLQRGAVPAQPFSRFFPHTAFAKQGMRKRGCPLFFRPYPEECHKSERQENIFTKWQGLTPSELRSRREERMENGVKNLKGSEAISQNLLVAF